MAPELTRTREDVLARALGEVGTWWPNPWWPNGRSTYNDCMAFVSWALYGLNGREPFYAWVPAIMERAIAEGRWAGVRERDGRRPQVAGTTDIQRGDVVVLDWKFIDSRDHVGIATGVIVRGHVIVMQTNNGGGGQGGGADSARVVSYPERYILGRYRPPYATADTAGGRPAPIPAPIQEEPMTALPVKVGQHVFTLAPGQIAHQANPDMAAYVMRVLTADDKMIPATAKEFDALLDALGIPRHKVDVEGGRVWNPAADNGKGGRGAFQRGGMWNWQREQLAAIGKHQ